MGTRPTGPAPRFATDLDYPAGAEAWSATPTKIKPPDGKLELGFEPSERPPAQWLNWLLGVYGESARYLDGIDVQNWTPTAVIDVGNNFTGVCWDGDFNRRMWACGDDTAGVGMLWKSANGINSWISAGLNPAATPLSCVAANPNNATVVAMESLGAPASMWENSSGVFAATVMPTDLLSNTFRGISYSQAYNVFIAWGHTAPFAGAIRPAIWTIAPNGSAVVQMTVEDAATVPQDILDVAMGSGSVATGVAISDNATPHLWTLSVGLTWVHQGNGFGFLSQPKAVAFSEADGLFMIVCHDGHVYVSSNGTIWNLVANPGGLFGNYQFRPRALRCRGSVWLAAVMVGSGPEHMLTYSLDAGVTWTLLPFPHLITDHMGMVEVVDRRFAHLSPEGSIAYSLRT